MNRLALCLMGLCTLLWACVPSASAQTNPNLQTGLQPYGSFEGSNFDSVSLTNANLTLHIPLFSYPQRGSIPGSVSIGYNNKNWYVYQHCVYSVCTDQWKWVLTGVHGVYINIDGGVGISWAPETSSPGAPDVFTAYTSDGSSHMMYGTAGAYYTVDGSGIFYGGSTNGGGPIRTRDGVQPLTADNNGNLSVSSTAGITTAPSTLTSDTMGRNLSPSGTSTSDYSGCVAPASPAQISSAYIYVYPGQGTSSRQLKVCGASYTATTSFNAVDPSGSPAIQEGSEAATFIVSVVLYNGTSWSTSPAWGFDYDSHGDLGKITLPTGGTISYTWGSMQLCTGSTNVLTQYSLGVGSRTVNAQDGTGPHTWNYNIGGSNSIVTDPDGNDTVHAISSFGTCGYYETQTQWYQGSHTSGTLLKTATTDYISSPNPYGLLLPNPAVNVLPIRVTTTWPNGQTTKVEKDYDTKNGSYSFGNVTAIREYDYGNNAPGPLLRTTTNAYLAFSSSSYLAANLLNLLSSSTITDANNNQLAQTTYTYDGYGLQSSGVTSQHDNTKANSPRGNRTSTCRWLTSGNVCTSTIYYDTGMPYQVTDANGNATTFTYSSTYNGAYVTQTNLPDTHSPNLAHHIISGTYDFNTGQLVSFTDQNNQSSSYLYDLLGRITSVSFPDTGLTTFTYSDVPLSAYVQRQEKIVGSTMNTLAVYFDGLARKKQTQLQSDPSGTVYTDFTYDHLGRLYTQSNPYRSTSDPTYGLTTYNYDPLNRQILVIPPDGTTTTNNVQTQYCGGYTLATDQSGHWRRSSGDGLGRLIEVDEPNSSTATVNVCPGTGEPIWATTYTYDGLNDLKTVVQNGSRNRSFSYDSLKRLVSSTNPESGTVTYAYDANGNVVLKTDARGISSAYYYDALNRILAKRFTDTTLTAYYLFDSALPTSSATTSGAGSVTITGSEQSFLQDCDNPPCQTIYDSGTVSIIVGSFSKSVTYHHGSSPTSIASALASAFNSDLSSPVNASSSSATVSFTARLSGVLTNYTLNSGAVTNDPNDFPSGSFGTTQSGAAFTGGSGTCTGSGITLTVTNSTGRRNAMCDAGGAEGWSFDSMGRELTEQRTTTGITKTTSYTYNPDGSLATLTYPSGRTITYTPNSASQPLSAVDLTNNINYATLANYAPQGALGSLTLGNSSGFAGIQLSDTYNKRLQPAELKASSTAGVAMDLSYSFVDSNSNNNGNVMQVTNNKDTTRNQTFSYDQVNRLYTAKTGATSGANCWSYTYGYDSWANLNSAQPLSGYTCTQSNLSLTVNANNQITNTGFSYDASGNTLNDGVNAYTWDAESQIKTAAGVTYTYDGDGNRLQKSSGKIYWYGAGSEVLDESDSSGNITDEYVFFGSKRIAHRVVSSGSIYYYAEDFIGSSRVITTSTGAVCYEADLQPFGKEVTPITNTCPQNYKFSGKERDTETGNDDFGARYYSSSLSRWLSPDWSAIPAPVPYATLTNPQSLNLYQFVNNSPETFADLDGHLGWPIGVPDPTVSNAEPNMSADIYGYSGPFADSSAGSQEYQDWLNEQQGQPPKQQAQNQQNQQNKQNTPPANSRTDVVLHGRDVTPTPQVETPGLWQMDWTASACSATGCSRPTAENEKQVITLVESENGGPWKSGERGAAPPHGVAHDHFSVEPRTVNQRWFVDGKQVQVVVGKDSKGNLIKAWEIRVDIKNFGDRPVYSPVH